MIKNSELWIFNVCRFWNFSPLAFVAAIVWNIFEITGHAKFPCRKIKCPYPQ